MYNSYKSTDNASPGIVYSNISLIKRALLLKDNRKIPYPEIVLFIKKHWTDLSSSSSEVEKIVNLALYAPKSHFVEDEEGLWKIKDQTDKRLDAIYDYVKKLKKPFKTGHIKYKLNLYETEDVIENLLTSDIRFMQVERTHFWVLTEWQLCNDEIFNYMKEKKISQEKIAVLLAETKYKYARDSIFAPEIDNRFKVNGNYVKVNLELSSEPTAQSIKEIPIEVKEELSRLGPKLIKKVKDELKGITVKDLLYVVLHIKESDASYAIYAKGVDEYLENVPRMSKLKDKWFDLGSAPDLALNSIEQQNYSVRGSIPLIKNINSIADKRDNEESDTFLDNSYTGKSSAVNPTNYAYYTVSYFDRIRGHLPVPSSLKHHSVFENQTGKLEMKCEEFIYEWWWQKKHNRIYFYGDGVMDFFADYLIEPGNKLKIQMVEDVVKIHLMGFDERYATEQERHLDIGKLVEQAHEINKSIFSLMCEILAIYPSGLHWTVLQDEIGKYRTTTKNTIYGLLSNNDCFEKVEDKKGYWVLNVKKLSRFYTDEHEEPVIEKLDEELSADNGEKESILEELNESESDKESNFAAFNDDLLITQFLTLLKSTKMIKENLVATTTEKVKELFTNGKLEELEKLHGEVMETLSILDGMIEVAQNSGNVSNESTNLIQGNESELNYEDEQNFFIEVLKYTSKFERMGKKIEDQLLNLIVDNELDFNDRTMNMMKLMKSQEEVKGFLSLLVKIEASIKIKGGDLV
ncbi:hypothetical protein [Guptibacillus hwajinpoensis]|uniref:hypothetical protein n=1 Tax=Guptibacillus hwajinpoensis TaxID=208199 RepID=UPI003D07B76A